MAAARAQMARLPAGADLDYVRSAFAALEETLARGAPEEAADGKDRDGAAVAPQSAGAPSAASPDVLV